MDGPETHLLPSSPPSLSCLAVAPSSPPLLRGGSGDGARSRGFSKLGGQLLGLGRISPFQAKMVALPRAMAAVALSRAMAAAWWQQQRGGSGSVVLERWQRRRDVVAAAAWSGRDGSVGAAWWQRLVRRASASPVRCAQQGDAGRGSRLAWTPCEQKSDLGSPCGVGHGD